jgi:phosphoribosylglycinamide formyltransferase 1
MKKVGILISGRGSNMVSLLAAMKEKGFPAECALVISNIKTAEGLQKAESMGIKTLVIDHKESATREEHDLKMVEALNGEGVDVVCLAGYMRLLSPLFIKSFPNAIINIHPALLPSFPGLHVQQKAIDAGARFSGCTVHIVDEFCDNGPILLQAAVPIFPGDSEEMLSQRILYYEHKLYPLSLRLFAEGRFAIAGNKAQLNMDKKEYSQLIKDLISLGDE